MPRPWLAGLLSILCPGLGHLYAGRVRAAIWIGVLLLVAFLGGFLLIATPGWHGAPVASGWLVGPAFVVAVALDAVRGARNAQGLTFRRSARVLLYAVFVVVLNVIFEVESQVLRSTIAEPFRMPSESMAPTLIIGDHIFADKRTYRNREPRRGDIVAFWAGDGRDQVFVKRIIGLPGDEIEFDGEAVTVNGALLSAEPTGESYSSSRGRQTVVFRETLDSRSYLITRMELGRRDRASYTVEPEHYFVVGDYRNNSRDSRHFGAVSSEDLIGVVTHCYFSFDSDDWRVRWGRIGEPLM